MKDAIARIVVEHYNFGVDKEDTPFRHRVVYINRPPNTPFFPIAASEKQYAAFRRSLVDPPHEPIPAADMLLSIGAVIAKYHISTFTIYETDG
jgi:hypothetical protein